MTALSPPVPGPGSSTSDDWELLLGAVISKLRLIGGDPTSATGMAQPPDAMARLQAGVLECAVALDQIHSLIRSQMLPLGPGPQVGDPALPR